MLDAPRWGGTSFKKSEKEDTGEKNQDVLFFENQFWLLSVWDLLRLTPWAFWFEIFTRHSSLCLLSFGWDLSPDSSHKIGNKFIIHHCQGWKEGSFVCETDWFFRGRILVCLTWNLSRFVPNSMKILMWNFRKKLFRENFSEILCKPRLSSTKTSEILPYFLKLYSRSILRLKKFTWVLSYVVCTQVRRHVHKQITKTRYGGRKARTFCFRKTSFVHSRFGTWYALLLGHSGLKVLPDVRHYVYWVLAEIWAPDLSQKIGNKKKFHHCHGWKEVSFVCETVWFFSWANTRPFDLKFVAFCPKFSEDSYVEFQEKTISGEFFINFV